MLDCGIEHFKVDSLVKPILSSSSVFSLPYSPMCAAIHRISRVLVDPRASRVSLQSLVVLLLVESKEIACIENKLSDHNMVRQFILYTSYYDDVFVGTYMLKDICKL